MTTTQTKNKPVSTLRDGSLKATIWANSTKQGGTRYSVEFSRSYTDQNGDWHDTVYFSNGEILRIANLANRAYNQIGKLNAEAKIADDGDQL